MASGVNSGVPGLNVNSGAWLGNVGGQGGLANGAATDILGSAVASGDVSGVLGLGSARHWICK